MTVTVTPDQARLEGQKCYQSIKKAGTSTLLCLKFLSPVSSFFLSRSLALHRPTGRVHKEWNATRREDEIIAIDIQVETTHKVRPNGNFPPKDNVLICRRPGPFFLFALLKPSLRDGDIVFLIDRGREPLKIRD